MIRRRVLVLSCFLVALTLNASAQQSAPTAPAPPPLVGTLAGHPDWPAAKNPGDVDTVDHLIAALYDVVSGPAGQRDWERFRALFVPDGRLGWIVPESAATKDKPARKGDAFLLTPDMFMQQNDSYFKTHGFFERSIAIRVEEFGNLVEVWSTKESRDAKDDVQPSSRGIDSFGNVSSRSNRWSCWSRVACAQSRRAARLRPAPTFELPSFTAIFFLMRDYAKFAKPCQ